MKRKLLSVFLSLAMVLTMMPVFAMAEDTPVGGSTTDANVEPTGSYEDRTGDMTYSDDNGTVSDLNYSKGVMTVTGNNVTVKNVNFGDKAKLIVNTTGTFTLENCTFNPKTAYGPEGSIRTAVTLNVGKAVVKDNKFDGVTNGYYNAIEFGIGDGQNDLNEAKISGNTFNSAIKNNYFNFYNMTDDAVIDISNNSLLLAAKASNGIRISNPRNAENVTFNITKDSYTYANDSDESPFEGLILLQDYSQGNATQDFTNININITKLSAPENAKQLLYVYEDRSESIINTNYPKLNGDNSITQFYAAKIEEKGYYKTINEAVTASQSGDTITLLKDTAEDVTVPSGKNIKLDLNNHNIESKDSCAIVNKGNLTIVGVGEVKATQSGMAAIANFPDATANINGGTFVSAKWYVIKNLGTMTIDGKVTIKKPDGNTDTSSLVDNGWVYSVDKVAGENINAQADKALMTIKSGEFTGKSGSASCSVIKNDDYATLEISGGTFDSTNNKNTSSSTTILNWNVAKISGGTFIGQYPLSNGAYNNDADKGQLTISGGTFTGFSSVFGYGDGGNGVGKMTITDGKFSAPQLGDIAGKYTLEISGGYFTSDPTEYLAEGKAVGSSDIDGYAYEVVDKVENAKPAESEVTSVPVKTIANASEATKEAAKEVKGVNVDSSSTKVIDAATKELANENTLEVNEDTTVAGSSEKVVDSLKALTSDSGLTKDNITLVYQSYIDVTVKEAVKSGDTEGSKKFTELTVDLTPMYRVVATKKNNVTDDKPIIIEGEATGDKTANAVVVRSAEKLDLKNVSYNVSLVLPSGFAKNDAKLSIKHVKDNGPAEYYTGMVKIDDSGALIVNFTTNGFSPFTVYAESAASMDGTLYPTLQAAVDAVEGGQTKIITVTKDNERASVSGYKSFIIKKGDGVSEVSITAASGYNLTIDGDKYTVSPRHSSSGSSTTTYTVTVGNVSNGTITSSHKSAASGATVTLTVKPAEGYAVEAVTAKDAKGNAVKVTEKDGKYTFAMPASNVTVSASFVKKGEQPAAKLFDDVAQGAYYYDAVKWAVDKGVTNGKTSNLFGSDDPCTRAQIVTFLWRAAGSPAASASVSFTDVKDSDYYAKAVAWAVEKGITNGTGDGKFSSDDTCTRAQCAAFLYRAAGSPEVTDAAAFGDVAADAYYAKAVAWAEKNGITNGLGNGKFGSDNSCTRAQIITFLYRTYQGK